MRCSQHTLLVLYNKRVSSERTSVAPTNQRNPLTTLPLRVLMLNSEQQLQRQNQLVFNNRKYHSLLHR